MLRIQRVLFPTDLSKCAERAYAHAVLLARAHDAELHVLHVRRADRPEVPTSELLPTPIAEVGKQLGVPAERLSGSLELDDIVRAQVEGESPTKGITGYAEEHGIDLIVMGTHGRSGGERLLAGSVAERVVREAPCPVMTIREGGDQSIRRMLVPVDFSERSKAAIPVAEALAAIYGAEIELLYVIDEDAVPMAHVPLLGPVRVSAEEVTKRFKTLMQDLIDEHRGEGVVVDGSITLGHPARDILARAAEDFDLIVMSTHGRSGLERLFMGSVAEKIVRRAPCPVLTLKSFGRSLDA